jgi:hypothetical protein
MHAAWHVRSWEACPNQILRPMYDVVVHQLVPTTLAPRTTQLVASLVTTLISELARLFSGAAAGDCAPWP